MKVLILNSGVGRRMGDYTKHQPKCMTALSPHDTILSRQLRQLSGYDVEVVITTGLFHQEIIDHCESLHLPLTYQFVQNPLYPSTNYIYSIYCAKALLEDDIILLHGDLVFDDQVLQQVFQHPTSCMVTSSTLPLPQKDFKAVIQGGLIEKIGVEWFHHAQAAQPLYKLLKKDWTVWLNQITAFCQRGETNCYAEFAFNQVWQQCPIYPLDVQNALCGEIDTPEDLETIKQALSLLQ